MKYFSDRSIIKVVCVALLLTTAMASSTTPSIAAGTSSSSAGMAVSTFMNTNAAVPEELETFAKQTIGNLSGHMPFKSWQDAALKFTPLGPGTHSWLVMLENNTKPLGYLIITSDDAGGYMLSEYGIGSELPYSIAPLEHSLAAASLVQAGSPGISAAHPFLPQGSKIEPLYSPMSPYFKITVKGKAPMYIHAVTYDMLPAPTSVDTANSMGQTAEKYTVISSSDALTPSPVTSTQGKQDPYLNLTWLTRPALTIKSGKEILRHLQANSRKSFVFTSEKHNAAFGAPFSLTGWQRWSEEEHAKSDIIYVSIPQRNQDLTRFVPAQILIESGTFHEE
ncbi:hypothetical protein [Paenibacillus dakarensis]|uniref:hypothetical protein n=1 Tax=Paenibacillus dakarensis TaxID=1527293 RepID=UPI0006D54E82|nr:hypothetical protein [Paenibacillus dakarensis]